MGHPFLGIDMKKRLKNKKKLFWFLCDGLVIVAHKMLIKLKYSYQATTKNIVSICFPPGGVCIHESVWINWI